MIIPSMSGSWSEVPLRGGSKFLGLNGGWSVLCRLCLGANTACLDGGKANRDEIILVVK